MPKEQKEVLYRTQIDFTKQENDDFLKLQNATGSRTKKALVEEALFILETIIEEVKKGNDFFFKGKNGEETKFTSPVLSKIKRNNI